MAEMKIEGDKLVVEQLIAGVDLDGDGKKSLEAFLVVKADKAEATEEIMKKVLSSSLPPGLKDLIGKQVG